MDDEERAPLLPDGRYDVLIVDVDDVDASHVALDITITAGARKGEVVRVVGARDALRLGTRDSVELLGWPAVLTVSAGVPAVTL